MGEAGVVNSAVAWSWSPWQPLAGVPRLTPAVLAEILDGGQAFRWYRVTPTAPGPTSPASRGPSAASGGAAVDWIGTWGRNAVRLRINETGELEWSGPASRRAETERALRTYFGAAVDFGAVTDALPWRSDRHLAEAIAAFPGLRILRQPFGETLLGFLCSATKQIVQIKQMLALLAQRHGTPVPGLPAAAAPPHPAGLAPLSPPVNRLPTWGELAEVPEPELRKCLLGFRARYIAETARFLAAHPGWLEETEALPYADAKARLCTLPGVGEKVADCVLLFGAGRLEAFPVDVWIIKTMARRYALEGWRPAQIAHFGRTHFGAAAGLAQQFLFAWERDTARQGRR